MFNMNRMANCHNKYQGNRKKVLCVCSAGLLRSPTAAIVLSQEPFNFNTRAAGVEAEFALIPVDDVLIEWADEIVCMEQWQADKLAPKMNYDPKPVVVLNIKDQYPFMDEQLVEEIKAKYPKK